MISWLLCLRFLAGITLGLAAVVFAVLGLIASVGFVTRKRILTSSLYAVLSMTSLMMAVIVFDPSKVPGALMGLLCLLIGIGLNAGIGLFNLSLVEKGWRETLTPVGRLLKRWLIFRDPG